MQFDNQKTRNVADVAARIMAGESVKTQPEMLEEELKGNQHKIDANKNNKIDAHDFKLLRSKKKVEEETEELEESHFKVGDKVKCKTSGMKGEVVKMDKEDGDEDDKYYTVKREDGTMKKMAPEDMTKINEASEKEEGQFHKKLDTLVHKTFGKRKEEMKEEAEQIDEVMFPGSKEYEKKYGQSPQQKLKKKGDTVPTSQGDMTKTDKGVAHRRRFTEMLESYTEGGLKYIASLVKEEPDNEQYTKEVEKAKAKDRGEDRNDKNIAAGKVDAVKVEEEVEQIDELSKGTLADYAKKATHSARIKQKIAKDFEAGAQRARKPDMKAAGEELSKKYQRKAQKREEGVGKAIDRLAKEEVEQVDEVLDSAGKFMSYATKAAASGLKSAVMGTGKYRKRQAGIQKAVEKAKAKVNEETEIAVINADVANGVEMVDIAEREMTGAEMKKREEIVKSMKKGLAGFKQRYGDRAKEVKYATATKQAMKD